MQTVTPHDRVEASMSAPTEKGLGPKIADRPSIIRLLQGSGGAPSKPELGLSAGETKYANAAVLGAGGMGQVHAVEDQDLKRRVAMKSLLPACAEHPQLVTRFVLEAQTVGGLQHPNILPVHDLGLDVEGLPYFTMPLVEGETLASVIARLRAGHAPTHEKYGFSHRLVVIQKICDALAYSHARGIIHRDLKPENVMIGAFGEVLVMDWGLAKKVGAPELPGGAATPRVDAGAGLTQRGDILGTPGFMAPEQVLGKVDEMDERTDVYALGALMYVFFTLNLPHTCATIEEQIQATLNCDPIPPSFVDTKHQGGVPVQISAMIVRALARRPENRFPTVAALGAEIRFVQQGGVRVVCPLTFTKAVIHKAEQLLDDHPMIIMSCLMGSVAIALLMGLRRLLGY
jgi:serine/threonine protein kinase